MIANMAIITKRPKYLQYSHHSYEYSEKRVHVTCLHTAGTYTWPLEIYCYLYVPLCGKELDDYNCEENELHTNNDSNVIKVSLSFSN